MPPGSRHGWRPTSHERTWPTSCLLGDGDPRFLEDGRGEIATHQACKALGGTGGGGARHDGLSGHRALQHLEPGVRRAVAVVESDALMGELLGCEDRRLWGDDEGRADDGAAPADLTRAY